ncbi:MAG: ribonuclease Y [Candidatus Sumerlaeia bacterium]|nr:ribonuclease Y [Candidatus Sumerlaeia bacterium]
MTPMDYLIPLLALVAGAIGGAWFWGGRQAKAASRELEEAQRLAEQERARAHEEADRIRKDAEAEREASQAENEKRFERELGRRRSEIDRTEGRLRKREEQLERSEEKIQKKLDEATKREEEVAAKLRRIEEQETRGEELQRELVRRAETVAGMSAEQARKLLLENLENEVRQDAAALVHRAEQEAKEQAEKKARQVITLAVQRLASDHVSETTVSVVTLPSDDMKGRIIGREGRNIRTLEQLTGVNFIIDDTPEAVVLSCFDPMRREIARLVLEALMADGRIHPARIEELVEKTERNVLDAAREAAEKACLELGLHDLHPELVKLMGRLKYRTSYGQNILAHSTECGHIAEIIASELGLDARLAKRATFLHDIGKAVSHEVEGTHAAIGASLAKKYRERPEVVHAIEAHHYEVEPRTLTAIIVVAADAISASRPGARRESLESYIKRLESLEAIASGFDGVEKSYALQAGRELRIIVQPDKLGDQECSLLARDISKKIEQELQYPGQIKVTVLREVRKTEYAR